MKLTRRTLLVSGAGAMAAMAMPHVARAQNLPRNIRMVIGSTSTGGDTYQNSSIVAEALAQKLGVNIRVDPVGTNEALSATGRDARGTTIMLHHDQIYLSYLYGVPNIPDAFADFAIGPTLAINPGDSFLGPKNSAYQSMDDIFAAAKAGERVRVAIQPGGVSEIGFTGMRNAARFLNPGSEANIVPVNTGSQADKNQAMWDDLADVINGSIQANEQFTQLPEDDQTAMRFVWITARPQTLEQAPEAGMGGTSRADMLKLASPQTSVPLDADTDFTFDKEFFLLFNKEMDQGLAGEIDAALGEIYAEGAIKERQTTAFFIPNYLPQAEAEAHLTAKRDMAAAVIEQLKS